jgi:hypothetical protein
MRWLVGFILLIATLFLGVYVLVKGYPYRLYSNWAEGSGWNRYYSLSSYRKMHLKPTGVENSEDYVEDYPQLWKEFPIRNSRIPLPTRHPLYKVLPLVDTSPNTKLPQIGIILQKPNSLEITRLYTLPPSLLPDFSLGQELFKLPFVRNRIMKLSVDDLWNEIFTREIVVKSKSLEEMIIDLYILYVRSKILPPETVRYGLGKIKKQGIIQLNSRDKGYLVEMILTQESGNIYSFILKTARDEEESMKLRSKFLQQVNFSPTDAAMGRILYTEFKQLSFNRQVDAEGMLYLFSAWSQNPEKLNFIKEMIFYLERGRANNKALSILYSYAFKRYGKTFATKNILTDHNDPEIELQRKIEVENIEKTLRLDRESLKPAPTTPMEPKERMNYYLRQAKELEPVKKEDMTVH